MQAMLQFNISCDAGSYTAEGVNAPIVTFGTTFEELQNKSAKLYDCSSMAKSRPRWVLWACPRSWRASNCRPCSQPFHMGVKLKVLSGEDVLAIFERFGFSVVSQKGDHVKLRRTMIEGAETLVVPLPRTIPRRTLKAIFKRAATFQSRTCIRIFTRRTNNPADCYHRAGYRDRKTTRLANQYGGLSSLIAGRQLGRYGWGTPRGAKTLALFDDTYKKRGCC
jgi:predicted RNA binding protein YcfA (HicA-like mRNA interferase family)